MAITLNGSTGGTASAGWYAQSAFTGTFSDGIVLDYTTGMGRISVGASDGLTVYNGGVASSALLTIDSSGNMGLGVTPSAWNTITAFQVKNAALGGYSTSDMDLTANAYYSSGWKYISNDKATYYTQSAGTHARGIAGTGTAGNAISFTQAMTLDASGRLLVGLTSWSDNDKFVVGPDTGGSIARISMAASAGANSVLAFQESTTRKAYLNWNASSLALGVVAEAASSYVWFSTANTERARIDSSGN